MKTPASNHVVAGAGVAVLYAWWPFSNGNPLVFVGGWVLVFTAMVMSGPPGPQDGTKKED
jgi:hypothetical protein